MPQRKSRLTPVLCLFTCLLLAVTARASRGVFDESFEDFDPTNVLAKYGWVVSGTATKSSLYHNLGAYSVEIAGGTSSIVKSFPLPDLTGIAVSYSRRTATSFGAGDAFYAEWFDGSNWIVLETITANVATFSAPSFTLPASAANNLNFKIRFRTQSAAGHHVYVDDVKILADYAAGGGESDMPHIVDVGPVKADILQVTMRDRRIIPGAQIPYAYQSGDWEATPTPPSDPNRWLFRENAFIGTRTTLAANTLWLWDIPTGYALNPTYADATSSYTIWSSTDPNYTTSRNPTAVYRKSKPNDYARVSLTQTDVTLNHELYLKLPYALVAGQQYNVLVVSVSTTGVPTLGYRQFTYAPSSMRSPAVHVSQIGFHPSDPAKVAFLSTWMGNGGKLDYTVGAPFQVLNDSTGAVVFSGTVALQKAYNATEITSKFGAKNTSLTNVYQMDFSGLNTAGTYRVYVPGVGCSYPFTIGTTVWQNAFLTSVKALYNQRSGVALVAPYTNAPRPRDHHPSDPGVVIEVSSKSLMDTSNGLDEGGPETFPELTAGVIAGQTLGSEAWGGYHDAGDWDRRIQHLETSIWLITLAEEFPSYIGSLNLNIPESGGSYPDVIDEALFNLDFYKRLQIASGTNAGAVRGGIEHDAHPRIGEAGWQDKNRAIAYAPDPWSSYWYAGTAGMMSYWFYAHGYSTQGYDYLVSALNAYNWAKAQNLASYEMGAKKGVTDLKNFAAASLFRLTGNADLHADFMATTDFAAGTHRTYEQRLGSWLYVRTVRDGMSATVKTNITNSYIADANLLVAGCADTGFRWTILSDPAYYYGLGAMSTSVESPVLVKAHLLTGNPAYLSTLVLSCQTGLGANPDNRVYTTGLGLNPILRPLDSDSRFYRNMATPTGLTTLGPADFSVFGSPNFTYAYFPASNTWPIVESYHDAWLDPFLTEYTVQSTIMQSYVAWGYLAALEH